MKHHYWKDVFNQKTENWNLQTEYIVGTSRFLIVHGRDTDGKHLDCLYSIVKIREIWKGLCLTPTGTSQRSSVTTWERCLDWVLRTGDTPRLDVSLAQVTQTKNTCVLCLATRQHHSFQCHMRHTSITSWIWNSYREEEPVRWLYALWQTVGVSIWVTTLYKINVISNVQQFSHDSTWYDNIGCTYRIVLRT